MSYSDLMEEEVLNGGNSNLVVRVGDSVRRAVGPWTPAVHELLSVLRAAAIVEVPEPRGFDERGREVLSFLPGEAGNDPHPEWMWAPTILAEAAALLRRIHDASVPLIARPLMWGSVSREPVEVICHNDVAPYNMAFVDGHVAGLFDFDTASPGPRIWDLAYLAYRLAPLTEDADHLTTTDRLSRIDQLTASYGAPYSREQILFTVTERLDDLAVFTDQRAAHTGRDDFLAHAAMYRRDRERIAALLG
jgi:prepilin-type processing-associated H-X9-DG protein